MDTPPSRVKLTQDLADAIRAQEEIIARARKALEDIRFTVDTTGAQAPIRLTNQVQDTLRALRSQTSVSDVADAAMALFRVNQAEVEEADGHLRRLSSRYLTATATDAGTLRRAVIDAWRTAGRPMPLAMFIADEVRQGRA